MPIERGQAAILILNLGGAEYSVIPAGNAGIQPQGSQSADWHVEQADDRLAGALRHHADHAGCLEVNPALD